MVPELRSAGLFLLGNNTNVMLTGPRNATTTNGMGMSHNITLLVLSLLQWLLVRVTGIALLQCTGVAWSVHDIVCPPP